MNALAVIEEMIVELRPVRSQPDHPDYRKLVALRQAAAQMRGRNPQHAGELAQRMQRKVDRLRQEGVNEGRLRALGEDVLGGWETIKSALLTMNGGNAS